MAAKILVVDDNELLRDVIADLLGAEGYDVAQAATAAEALASLATRHPDVLVLDLLLPDMDGATLLGRIRADPSLRDVRVLVATAMSSPHVRRLVQTDGLLFKPFEMRDLVTTVARLAAGRAA